MLILSYFIIGIIVSGIFAYIFGRHGTESDNEDIPYISIAMLWPFFLVFCFFTTMNYIGKTQKNKLDKN